MFYTQEQQKKKKYKAIMPKGEKKGKN